MQWDIMRSSMQNAWTRTVLYSIGGTIVCLVEPPYAERHVRWWCAMKAVFEMREGPSIETCQEDLSNNPWLL